MYKYNTDIMARGGEAYIYIGYLNGDVESPVCIRIDLANEK